MKIGFMTACMPEIKLEELVPWASENGFDRLEVACWPDEPADRAFGGVHHIKMEDFDSTRAEAIRALFQKHALEISALAYYPNNLDPDLGNRKKYHNHLRKVIDAASMLGVDLVGTFIGGDKYKSIQQNLAEFEKVFPEIVDYAERRKVKLMIENCPMFDFWATGYNVAFSPVVWKKMFEIIPSQNFGLNYDPSHFIFLGIDYLRPLKEFADRIFHVHAKDAEVFEDVLKQAGIHGEGWWRYRMSGSGEVNWKKFVDMLYEIGFNGTISIEHEDPTWWGTEEKVKTGLVMGQKYLRGLLLD
ncbi:hypothetical protein HKBW3S03_00416 [Candidatus Hakubella thermalkaliphila]|uniref:Xylose isomerase-like TIM barrel domain-containing protein n=2 Tax=Candidatus Hakubella thermalkaliphila TaxID=2754717 RepID=A0A6V8Q1L5_9ACTN|nr:sugar phosphate isomerase/epimerase [Candidatus Hakubella thermalkaliphila]GFP18911.1 hypothetical protein HKBW3S03_00416 [Candidatus Hakubella thermalkaliphila]GFP29118.1 hypothetical protein HKBW3S34_00037 [Candidatus Hakubella thermalkaliphila]GFP36833.1 hypothetical protein HKBW3S44_00514 [Candidatus Hakubella thermalkaliphila]GFP38383.1 hypothetical protein HKBW3S47_00084 [Candidatus Hakubella thermalkaliphila]GFP42814.1 hypothetical protein HKBW3C_01938 [Candidatus Hakubella thermalka